MNRKQLNAYSILFGNVKNFPLHHNFLIATSFFGWLFSFASIFVNIVMNYGFILIFVNIVFSILFFAIYLLARFYQINRGLVIPTVTLLYFICIYIWILTEGTRGGGQYIFFPSLCASLFLVRTKGKIILLFTYISSLVTLFAIEYYAIFNIVLYQTAFDRLFDISFTFIVSICFTVAAFLIVAKNYNDSQRIIFLRNDEIESELEVARLIQKNSSR